MVECARVAAEDHANYKVVPFIAISAPRIPLFVKPARQMM